MPRHVGERPGNFPRALSHVGVIAAAGRSRAGAMGTTIDAGRAEAARAGERGERKGAEGGGP